MSWINLKLPHRIISREEFIQVQNSSPRRRRCYDHPIMALGQRDRGYYGFANIPFWETFDNIFYDLLGKCSWKNSKGNLCLGLENEEEYTALNIFFKEYERCVFIKSLLHCMIALDMNFETNTDNYTEIGYHEHNAKENRNNDSFDFLVKELGFFIQEFPCYQKADAILAIPGSCPDKPGFPARVAKAIGRQLELPNYSGGLKFLNKVASLQHASVSEKWKTVEQSGLTIHPLLPERIKDKDVILLDDLYQSGTTMHFVAMHLQKAGARNILGLAMVKSRRDTDNQTDDLG